MMPGMRPSVELRDIGSPEDGDHDGLLHLVAATANTDHHSRRT